MTSFHVPDFFHPDRLDASGVPTYDVDTPFVFYLSSVGRVVQEFGTLQTRVTVPLIELDEERLQEKCDLLLNTAAKVMGIKGDPTTRDPFSTGRYVQRGGQANLLLFEPRNLSNA